VRVGRERVLPLKIDIIWAYRRFEEVVGDQVVGHISFFCIDKDKNDED
jgi:hypothetical protein